MINVQSRNEKKKKQIKSMPGYISGTKHRSDSPRPFPYASLSLSQVLHFVKLDIFSMFGKSHPHEVINKTEKRE
jgi:hypothetical protein